jgi:hypothetical protein
MYNTAVLFIGVQWTSPYTKFVTSLHQTRGILILALKQYLVYAFTSDNMYLTNQIPPCAQCFKDLRKWELTTARFPDSPTHGFKGPRCQLVAIQPRLPTNRPIILGHWIPSLTRPLSWFIVRWEFPKSHIQLRI